MELIQQLNTQTKETHQIDQIRHETTMWQVKTQEKNKSLLNCLLDTLKHILDILLVFMYFNSE